MDLSERCEITELFKDQCAHCRKILSPEEEEAQSTDVLVKRLESFG